MDLDKLLERNRKEVNAQLKRFLPKKISTQWLKTHGLPTHLSKEAMNEFLTKPAWYFLDAGGKRWRALLMLICCACVGGNPKHLKSFTIIPELIHNGTLIADDIEDGSLMRRGKPALHRVFGLDIAVNVSSLLYYLPLLVIKQQKNLNSLRKTKIYELINEELLKLHLGQGTDIHWKRGSTAINEAEYFAMCANKTGTLARLSAKLGAFLGGGNEAQIKSLGAFAEALGVAFQIQDDVLNIKGGLGKTNCEDITEGKISLPLIKTLAAASAKDRRRLLAIITKHTTDHKEIQEAANIIRQYGGLESANETAIRIIKRAWRRLDPLLKSSPAKKRLFELSFFAIERRH